MTSPHRRAVTGFPSLRLSDAASIHTSKGF